MCNGPAMLFMILRFTWKRTGVGGKDGTIGNCYHIMCYGIGNTYVEKTMRFYPG